jgi:hypothetical protein
MRAQFEKGFRDNSLTPRSQRSKKTESELSACAMALNLFLLNYDEVIR